MKIMICFYVSPNDSVQFFPWLPAQDKQGQMAFCVSPDVC